MTAVGLKEDLSRRLDETKKMMKDRGWDALLVTSNADTRYLTNYNLIVGAAAVFVSLDNDAILLINQEWDLLRAKEESPFRNIQATSDIALELPRTLERARLRGNTIGVVGWNSFPVPLYLGIKKILPYAKFRDASEGMKAIRMMKGPLEIEWLERAARITDAGAGAAMRGIEEDKKEVDVALMAEVAMKSEGSTELSFPTVLGSGDRTALIVPMPTQRRMQRGELVLMDLGGRFNGYCGDISRTKLCGGAGAAKEEQKDLFGVVSEMHRKAIQAVKPGMKASEIHDVANQVANEAGYGQYLRHLTGHGIGLEDHEKPIFETEETPLQAGMVHSIEPGLYVADVGGVRIEDMLLVTESGAKLLTTSERDL